MPEYTYLIIGGGMTAASAINGIREVDPRGSIGVLSADKYAPYDRPPLSKKLWKGEPLESIWRQINGQGVTLHLGRTARQLDPQNKRINDDQGTGYGYGKLLLATGGTPRRLPFGGEQIIYYRTVADYERLRALTRSGQQFAVIGGGFIGSEIAAALAMNGKKVVIVVPDAGVCSRLFPSDLVNFLNDFYKQKGVEVLAGQRVNDIDQRELRSVVRVGNSHGQSEREIVVDGVVAGIGIQPNVELAQEAGLEVENGIRVDASLRTSLPDIYAAGDVANFYHPALETRLRVEHEDNANTMGRQAGQSMAGKTVNYDHLPFFYSDMFELGYEAVGEVDSRHQTVADWKQPYREGVVYYLRHGRVRGVLLWNVWEQVESARKLIAEPGPFRPEDLKGRLPA
ncbi:MAG TPA: FAD/NAD(P)-binding oxidoreductase [Tepidisphaeraceae bacterium]|jgi:NADPH-dependent 2,4-dienoyl-CoA reductase/sulfur reductase-like enzyme